MLLKRIELQGFKSFARRTAFDFEGGITAVVGPNGSGKSNIADAVRWVIGEQSSRLIRTKKLEEVIFAGSSQRTPVGMAEVSLFLDNSDGVLPVDFSEVCVSRRAYRSGESEYYINNSRVRLRDVVEILLKGNIGQNGYTVVGQGLVETLLNLRPEERRALVEEAAGVKGHRLKMAESQDKLKATRDNVERIGYIISEIVPRLAKLEQQSRRAREEAKLRRSYIEALRSWYSGQWRNAQAQAEAAGQAVERCRREVDEARAELAQVEERAGKLRAGIEAERREQEQFRRRQEELERALQQAAQELRLGEQRCELLDRQQAELTEEVSALEAERQDLDAQLVSTQSEESQAGQRVESQRTALRELEDERQRLGHELEHARKSLTAVREVQMAAVKSLAQFESQLAQTEDRLAAVDEERRAARERRRELAASYVQLWGAVRRGREELARTENELAEVTSRREAVGNELEQVRSEVRALESELQRSRQEKDMAEQRLSLVVGEKERFGFLADGVRAILERSASPAASAAERRQAIKAYRARGRGVLGWLRRLLGGKEAAPPPAVTDAVSVLVNIIDAPSGLELAIESALEGVLQALVVPHWKDALAAIQYLTQTERGRATFLPLDSLREIAPINVIKEPGVIGVASKLVRCAPQHRKLIDVLLGRTIIVEDLETARHIVKRGTGNVVTSRGELLLPNGAMIGGRRAKAEETSILQQATRAREIPEMVIGLEQSMAEASARLAEQEARLQYLEAELEALTQIEARLRPAARESSQSLAADTQRAEMMRQEMRWLTRSLLKQAREKDALDEARGRLVSQQADASVREAEAGASLQALIDALQSAEAKQAAFAGGYAEARSALAGLQREIESRRAGIAGQRSALQRLDQQLQGRRSRQAQVLREIEQVEATIAALKARHDGLLAQRREQPQGGQQQGGLLERELDLQHLRASEESQRRQVAGLERELLRAEDTAARAVDSLGHIRAVAEAEGLILGDDGSIALSVELEAEASASENESLGLPAEPEQLKRSIETLRARLRNLGSVSRESIQEYEELKQRHGFLTQQMQDLRLAEENLQRATQELQGIMRERFASTFKAVAEEFERYFTSFFGGGKARLLLTEEQDSQEPGVDIIAQPPGKRLQSLNLLSGGERALTATALLFALLRINPPPFCVLDEVDASLDDANVLRFCQTLRQLAESTHFILITHNHATVEAADNIYGISMDNDKVSRVLSLRLNGARAG
ncbi:MAG: chromosome segregation protein SMC [Chloroflexi bacterium]|nr:chromosome segregation protein SMC [Chloroflexota bacterium]